MKKVVKRSVIRSGLAMLLAAGMVISSGCSAQSAASSQTAKVTSGDTNNASSTPFGKYSSLVTYTLGKMTSSDPKMPNGDSWENNAYTRYIKDKLNIQSRDAFEANGGNVGTGAYDQKVAMSIASGNIPDVMIIDDLSTLKQLVDNDMIQDLTSAYKTCTSDKIKEIYNSYKGVFTEATFDGKLMALPSTNISAGCNFLWLRKDWMDKLGLKSPQTLDDVENIIQQFIQKDPGGNGKGKTIGLAASANVGGSYGSEYMLDSIFALYGAYPKQWIKNTAGNITYGSVAPEMKSALQKLADMYQKGEIDKQFAVRTDDDINGILINGSCGAFFGPWWSSKTPLINSYKQNKSANWQPYIAPLDSNGKLKTYTQAPANEWVVVKKGYEHPEVVMKSTSLIFDYNRYTDKASTEINNYTKKGVSRNTIPININVDYNDGVIRTYENISAALKDPSKTSNLLSSEQSYYESCKTYVKDPKKAPADAWANYLARMTASGLCKSSMIQNVDPVFFGKTDSMKLKWANLQKLEQESMLKIITGEQPVTSFDGFVQSWNSMGGEDITKEVTTQVNSKK